MRRSSAVVQRTVALRDCSASELPRAQGLLAGEIFVGGGDYGPDGLEARAKLSLSKFSRTSPMAACVSMASASSCGFNAAGLGNFGSEVFLDERGGAAGEIAEAVGEVAVVAGDEGVVAEIAVLAEDDVAKKE